MNLSVIACLFHLHSKIFKLSRFAALIIVLALVACAGAPVQEMSNARQAVAAAQQNGGSRAAPHAMAEAQRLLQAAQAALDRGDYSAAHRDALRARSEAIKVLRIAQGQQSAGLSPLVFPVFSLC